MDIAELLHRPVGRPYRKDGVNDLFHLGRQRVLDIQKIDHDNEADQDIFCQVEDGEHTVGNSSQDLFQALEASDALKVGDQITGGPVLHGDHRLLVHRKHHLLQGRVIGKQPREPLIQVLDIHWHGVHDPRNAGIKLGDDHHSQAHNDDVQKRQAEDRSHGLLEKRL